MGTFSGSPGISLSSELAFTRCRHILKTVKNVTVAKFELAFTRCRNNLKTVRNLTVRSSFQDFDAIERYLHLKCRSVLFQKLRKLFYFHHFQVFTRCRFQNVPDRVQFSKSTIFQNVPAKNVPFSCEREAYPSHFSPFSKCASIV